VQGNIYDLMKFHFCQEDFIYTQNSHTV
jgi:hypothetical protein